MTTFEKVAKILAEYKNISVDEITPDTTFEELELDSLDTVELVMNLEEELKIAIEMTGDIKKVADIINIIENA